MRKLHTQIKVSEVGKIRTLEEKVKDMLFRMYCSLEDEVLDMTVEPTVVISEIDVIPGVSCVVNLNGIKELSETDMFTFLEEDGLFNKHISINDYGNISLKFDSK